jgi:hypothetical protein
MPEVYVQRENPKIVAATFRIKHNDIFSLRHIYRVLHEWVKENQWVDKYGDSEGDRHESFFYDKTTYQGHKEMWMWWRLQQFPDAGDDSENSFYKWHMDIDFHILYLRDHEILQEGKKVKTNKGEVEIYLHAWVEIDYTGKFSKHPILRFWKDWFNLRLFETDLDKQKFKLYREAALLQGMIKKHLALYGHIPEQQIGTSFSPSRGTLEGRY